MRIFKRINRGLILTLVILCFVFVHICVLAAKHDRLEKESASFIAAFFKAEENWKSIPEEFRQDSDEYIKSIEQEAKMYFDNEKVYEYYIKDVILSQYESGKFLKQEECEYSMFETYGSNYDGELLQVSVFVGIGSEIASNYSSDNFTITLKESDSGLKIVSFAQPFSNEYSIE